MFDKATSLHPAEGSSWTEGGPYILAAVQTQMRRIVLFVQISEVVQIAGNFASHRKKYSEFSPPAPNRPSPGSLSLNPAGELPCSRACVCSQPLNAACCDPQ